MKILIIGKSGQLGQSIKKVAPKVSSNDEFIFVGREELDLNNTSSIRNYFNNININNVVIRIRCNYF